MRIGVFGHVGNHNLGDEALIAAVLQNVRRRYPGAELRAFTGRPHDTEQRHRIVAFPIRRLNGRPTTPAPAERATEPPARRRSGILDLWPGLRARLKRLPALGMLVRTARRAGRWTLAVPLELPFLIKSYGRLRGTDLLLVAGSAQLNDYWGGPWGFPFTLFKWLLLARATGTKVALLSLGAGPLQTRLGKFFIRRTLRLAHYCSFRDDDSRRCVGELGVPGERPVVPDLVFSLRVARSQANAASARHRVVGINPMPVFDDAYWPENDRRVYGHYVQTLASFADWLVERGYDVRFFPTQLLVDPGVIDAVRRLMKHHDPPDGGPRILAERIQSFDQLMSAIDGLDLVVATRYHGCVFSLIRRKPLLSIAYQPKATELMAQMGLADHVIALDRLTLPTLRDRFLALEGRETEWAETIQRRLPAVRQALTTQYGRAFALLETGRVAPLQQSSCARA